MGCCRLQRVPQRGWRTLNRHSAEPLEGKEVAEQELNGRCACEYCSTEESDHVKSTTNERAPRLPLPRNRRHRHCPAKPQLPFWLILALRGFDDQIYISY